MLGEHLIEASEATFATLVAVPGLVVVDLWAIWCGPCQILAPTLDAVAKEFAGQMTIVTVDVTECPGIAATYGVRSVPTLLYFKDGVLVERSVGAVPRGDIVARIRAHLGGLSENAAVPLLK